MFVNGLVNDLAAQVRGGLTGAGQPIHMVFGAPVSFGPLLQRPSGPRTYAQLAETCLSAIGALGQEEKAIREAQRA